MVVLIGIRMIFRTDTVWSAVSKKMDIPRITMKCNLLQLTDSTYACRVTANAV
jgi:hypothetical protein